MELVSCVRTYLDGIQGVASDNSTHTTYSSRKKVLQSTWLLSTTTSVAATAAAHHRVMIASTDRGWQNVGNDRQKLPGVGGMDCACAKT